MVDSAARKKLLFSKKLSWRQHSQPGVWFVTWLWFTVYLKPYRFQ